MRKSNTFTGITAMSELDRSAVEAQYDHDYVDPDEGTTLPSDNTSSGGCNNPIGPGF